MSSVLTGVSTVMRFEVRALGVCLAASSEGAGVCGRALPRPGAPPALRFGLEQVEWGGRGGEERARRTGLHHAEALIEQARERARSRVAQRHRLMQVLLLMLR